MKSFYPILVTLFTLAVHFLLASAIGAVIHSYSSAYAGYFLVMSFRYCYAINNFAYQYAVDPTKTEKVLRESLNKHLEKNNEH